MTKNLFSREKLAIPYVIFLVLFVVFPLLVVVYYAFTNGDGNISFANFIRFFQNGKTLGTLIYSIVIALITTIICLLMAYPVAFILAKGEYAKRHTFLMLFVLPMWINFTLRITALKEILTVTAIPYMDFTIMTVST